MYRQQNFRQVWSSALSCQNFCCLFSWTLEHCCYILSERSTQSEDFRNYFEKYYAFKSGVLIGSQGTPAQFWARYTDVIKMALILIRVTEKNKQKQLRILYHSSECLVPNVMCVQLHHLRTICTYVPDNIAEFV